MSVSPPRQAAFNTLLRIEKERSYADILIDRELAHGQLSGADRGLYTELVYGTLRKQGTLDHIMASFSSTPLARLERAVLLILRLGLYQLFCLDRIPASAAVNESVNLAKVAAPKAAGFINAVLRSADRGRDRIVYPDPATEPVAYLAARYSHPEWIVAAWLEQLGMAEAEQLAAAMVEQPPLTIRVNSLKLGRDELISRLAEEGVGSEPCSRSPYGLKITSQVAVAKLPLFSEGFFSIQDEASQLATLLLTPREGEQILDLCAAPGGKSGFIAELTNDNAFITACDRHPRRVEQIGQTAGRLGIRSITTQTVDASKPLPPLSVPFFDRILVDAPCSGLGVIHRNPEGKWWKQPADLVGLAAAQGRILSSAADRLKPGGVLVYSTCSTTIQEDEAVVENFLTSHPEFVIEPVSRALPEIAPMETSQGFFRSWPHRDGLDGFFAARLIRRK
ncbi:MAG: 16S rRNA (cytosine(967)-C(5))-methyltransferase RsmB [Geobacter sp.]|nr:16S rRNA (cytosine(967)-C(5))-methyltransferase RsmB [Geobacter sp.]